MAKLIRKKNVQTMCNMKPKLLPRISVTESEIFLQGLLQGLRSWIPCSESQFLDLESHVLDP